MTSFRFILISGAFALVLLAMIVASMIIGQAQSVAVRAGLGIPDGFLRRYVAFRAAQLASGTPQVMRVRLGFVKGLSRSFTAIAGEFTVDLESAAFRLNLDKLTPQETYGVWLVDVGAGSTGDTNVRLATVRATSPTAIVTGTLTTAATLPDGFMINRIVVASGADPSAAVLASGSPNVFQKLFFRRLSLSNESTATVLFE